MNAAHAEPPKAMSPAWRRSIASAIMLLVLVSALGMSTGAAVADAAACSADAVRRWGRRFDVQLTVSSPGERAAVGIWRSAEFGRFRVRVPAGGGTVMEHLLFLKTPHLKKNRCETI
jgi:hypothetical protein